MNAWLPRIDRTEGSPLYLRLARAIAADLASGRLEAGARLPGTRALASRLELSRNTVNAAFTELEAEGWIVSRGSSGTYVNLEIAALLARDRGRRFLPAGGTRTQVPERPGFALGERPRLLGGERLGDQSAAQDDPGVLRMGGGLPHPRLCPTKLLARTYRSVLVREPELLGYMDGPERGRGHPRLLAVLARYLSERRALACAPAQLMVTRGAQMGIWLVGAALVQPGDRVAVERYGYRPAWHALRAHGAELIPISVDDQGLCIDKLEAALRVAPIRAVYLTPHHQFPTAVALAPARRARLLELARAHRFAIIEDDYDNEYHHEGQPLLPLASADRDGTVIYVGSLAKVLAPGLRVGWIVAPEPVLDRCASIRELIDRQGDALGERVLAELFEDGEIQRHMWRTRRVLSRRRDVLIESANQALGSALSIRRSSAGLALWAHVDPSIDVDAWAARGLGAGVEVRAGRVHDFRRRPRSRLRIGFGYCDEAELREGVARLAKVL